MDGINLAYVFTLVILFFVTMMRAWIIHEESRVIGWRASMLADFLISCIASGASLVALSLHIH